MPTPTREPTETIQLSTGTWLKIMGVLVFHTAILVGSALKMVNTLEQRMTRVETNQELLLDQYKQERLR